MAPPVAAVLPSAAVTGLHLVFALCMHSHALAQLSYTRLLAYSISGLVLLLPFFILIFILLRVVSFIFSYYQCLLWKLRNIVLLFGCCVLLFVCVLCLSFG